MMHDEQQKKGCACCATAPDSGHEECCKNDKCCMNKEEKSGCECCKEHKCDCTDATCCKKTDTAEEKEHSCACC